MEQRGQGITIGIESAIEGGSLALYRDWTDIDGTVGEKGISRAEDILPGIDLLLRRNQLQRQEIGRIVVTTGPGSFTGIKIGIATALGFADGIGCPVVGISSLDAMTYLVGTDGLILPAVPIGRDFVAVQFFNKISGKAEPISAPEILTEAQFIHTLKTTQSLAVLHSELIERLSSVNATPPVDAGQNIASLAVRGYFGGAGRQDIVPLFIDRKPPAVAV